MEVVMLGTNANPEKKTGSRRLKISLLVILSLLIFATGFGYLYLNSLMGKMDIEKIEKTDEALGIGERIEEHLSDTPIIPPPEVEEEEDAEVVAVAGQPEKPAIGGQAANEVIKLPENDNLSEMPVLNSSVSGITNIALFGVDAPEGMFGRSDTIMILTIDTVHDKIKLTSIVRDSYVYIPGKGMDKLAHAYAYGGAQLALRTLNSNFQLGIRNFITVNFTTLPKIIDILGGVQIKVTDAESNRISGLKGGGTYTLSGKQSLEFSRIRAIDNDFERSRRQRDIMNAVFSKMLSTSPGSYPRIMGEVFPLLKTSMSSGSMIRLAGTAATNGIRRIEQMRFPQASLSSGQRINNRYYYVFNRSQTLLNINNYIFKDSK
jgi:LCP family protein required for cell wall assembly